MLGINSGKKNFNRCSLRSQDSPTHAGLIVRYTLNCPKTEDNHQSLHVQASSINGGDSRFKDTTYTADNYWVYKEESKALDHLREVAGKVVCADCPFSTMTPRQVENTRLEVADERASLAEVRAERLAADLRYRTSMAASDDIQRQLDRYPDSN